MDGYKRLVRIGWVDGFGWIGPMDEGNWTFLNEWMTLDVLKKVRKFQCVSINQQTTQPPNHTTTNLHHQTTPPPTHTTTNSHHHQPTPPTTHTTTNPHHHQPTPPPTHTTTSMHQRGALEVWRQKGVRVPGVCV